MSQGLNTIINMSQLAAIGIHDYISDYIYLYSMHAICYIIATLFISLNSGDLFSSYLYVAIAANPNSLPAGRY